MSVFPLSQLLFPDFQELATRCDFCANACGHCSWSQKFVQAPVPGWDAVRNDIPLSLDAPPTESYVVIHCPQFSLEPHRRKCFLNVDWESVRQSALECSR